MMTTAAEKLEALAFLVELLEMGVDLEAAKAQTVQSYEIDELTLDTAYANYAITRGVCLA
jgi:hypothetical protein